MRKARNGSVCLFWAYDKMVKIESDFFTEDGSTSEFVCGRHLVNQSFYSDCGVEISAHGMFEFTTHSLFNVFSNLVTKSTSVGVSTGLPGNTNQQKHHTSSAQQTVQ